MGKVNLIVAPKGHKKTQTILEHVSDALVASRGAIVMLRADYDRDVNLRVPHAVRLISAGDYPCFHTFAEMYAFVCGLLASNYDITHLFIDGTLRIVYPNGDGAEHLKELHDQFVKPLLGLIESTNIDVEMTVSCSEPAWLDAAVD